MQGEEVERLHRMIDQLKHEKQQSRLESEKALKAKDTQLSQNQTNLEEQMKLVKSQNDDKVKQLNA